MSKFVNEQLNIKVGSLVEHKSDERSMVVVDFGHSSSHVDPEWKDKNKPICRFFQDKTQSYIAQEFVFDELIVIDEE